jgi:hypothetical protein
MVFIFDESDKPRRVDNIDRIVSAENANPLMHPLAHEEWERFQKLSFQFFRYYHIRHQEIKTAPAS